MYNFLNKNVINAILWTCNCLIMFSLFYACSLIEVIFYTIIAFMIYNELSD